MSAAILAKTAKERANIAIRIIKNNIDPFTRALDDCFEMGDGDEVVRLVLERAKRDEALMVKCREVFTKDVLARIEGESMNQDLTVNELSFVDRTGLAVLVITAQFAGRIIEVDTYRASDLAHMESKSLEIKGGK